jgi:hypothetical protein
MKNQYFGDTNDYLAARDAGLVFTDSDSGAVKSNLCGWANPPRTNPIWRIRLHTGRA